MDGGVHLNQRADRNGAIANYSASINNPRWDLDHGGVRSE